MFSGLRNTFRRRKNSAASKPRPYGATDTIEIPVAPKPSGAAGPDFPRFHASASDQLDPAFADKFDAARLKLSATFTPSQSVIDRRLFAGRRDVVTALIRAIEEQRLHAVVYGDRGIGKTSILHVLTQAAREAHYLVIYLSCGAVSSFDEIFRSITAAVPLLYHSGYGPLSPEAEHGDTLADILPPGPVSVRAASELCAKLVGTRVLILLDEFDRSESAEFKRNITEFMKNLSDRSGRAQLAVAGVAADLSEMLAEIPAVQRNIFALEVPKMPPEEIRELVSHGEAACGLSFEAAALELIVEAANGLPYLASLLSRDAGLMALDERRSNVTSRDVSAAVAGALSELTARLSHRSQKQVLQLARDGDHAVLGRLAGASRFASGIVGAADINAVFPNPDENTLCQSLLTRLADKGVLIEPHNDDLGRQYRFIDPIVPPYLWLLAVQARFLAYDAPGHQRPGTATVAPEPNPA